MAECPRKTRKGTEGASIPKGVSFGKFPCFSVYSVDSFQFALGEDDHADGRDEDERADDLEGKVVGHEERLAHGATIGVIILSKRELK